jgi:predicted phage-related endonuclease
LEEPIAQRYTRKTGIALRPLGELVHPVYNWAGGHIDREAVDESLDVECKSVDPWDRERQWSLPGEVQRVPEYVTLQVCWYLTMRGYSRPHHIAAQRGFRPLQVYPFNPTDQIQRIGANLLEQAHQFIEKYVKTGNPPPLGDGPAADGFLARFHMKDPKKELSPAPPGTAELVARYEQAKSLSDKWTKEKKAIRNDIAALVGDRYGLAGESFTATWPETPSKTEAVTDYAAVAMELAEDNELEIPVELIQKHTQILTVRKGYRTFKVNTKKG